MLKIQLICLRREILQRYLGGLELAQTMAILPRYMRVNTLKTSLGVVSTLLNEAGLSQLSSEDTIYLFKTRNLEKVFGGSSISPNNVNIAMIYGNQHFEN